MSQIDEEVLPGAAAPASPTATPWQAGDQEVMGNDKFVTVEESRRYRKRAQSAERCAEELAGELADAKAEASRLAGELKATQKEKELIKRLTAEGARDLDAAVLIAKARLSHDDKADLGGVVEQLKREKGYLFSDKAAAAAAVRTSPAKDSSRTGTPAVERAARRAAETGRRADLQEYMRKRRVLSF